MICALLLGRKGSQGLPGKNLLPLCGHPLAWWPLTAALGSRRVQETYLSTDDPLLAGLARELGAQVIERPAELCGAEALGSDAFKHGFGEICRREGRTPEMVALMFCNCPTILADTIDAAVNTLWLCPQYDSACTVSRYTMYSPARARTITASPAFLYPAAPEALLGATCDRRSTGETWYVDCGCAVVRARCLEQIEHGPPPMPWLGQHVCPLPQEAGLDVDEAWQVPQAEWWLRKYRSV